MSAKGLRRALHASSVGAAIAAYLGYFEALRLVLQLGTPLVLALDLTRIHRPEWNRWLNQRVPVFRAHESERLSGAAWLWMGFAAATFFPREPAIAGMAAAALADPAASVVGAHFGRAPGKSWPGTLAALVVAAGTLWVVGIAWQAALCGALVAAALERWPGRFDDNLLLPPGVAATVLVFA